MSYKLKHTVQKFVRLEIVNLSAMNTVPDAILDVSRNTVPDGVLEDGEA
jgi:hypothetical protein